MDDDTILRRCHRCSCPIGQTLLQTCPLCDMVYYCSQPCLVNDKIDHEGLCEKMIYYKQLTPLLLDHPFTYTQILCSEACSDREIVKFLKQEGVFNLGLWIRETPQSMMAALPGCIANQVGYGELVSGLDPYVLPLEGLALEDFSISPPAKPLSSWAEYYNWRGFPLSSPIALLMHHTLTLYHVIQISEMARRSSLVILLAGVEKEADQLLTFAELSALMPETTISIVMVGPQISPKTPNSIFRHSNLKIVRYSATLQEYLQFQGAAYNVDLVICLNAGLAAYISWKDAVIEIVKRKLKCYVTDYCLLSLDFSQLALNSLIPQLETEMDHLAIGDNQHISVGQSLPGFSSVKLSEPQINPFRAPKRNFCDSAKYPWFANAFVCQLVYS